MKKILIIITFFLCNACKPIVEKKDTQYVGFEKIDAILDVSKPEYKWFHKTLISFIKDSVFIYQSPVSIFENDTLYSESDGGFYYYKGLKKEFPDRIEIKTIETHCDYCPELVKINEDSSFQKVIRQKNMILFKSSRGLKTNETEYVSSTDKTIKHYR